MQTMDLRESETIEFKRKWTDRLRVYDDELSI